MLVVSLDALVCGLKLPRALRGFVQQGVAADGPEAVPPLNADPLEGPER